MRAGRSRVDCVNSTRHASEIKLVDPASGKHLSHERALLSSVPYGWRGILVEWHRLAPQEVPEHYVDGHGLSVSTGSRPIPFGWKDRGTQRDGRLNPGEFHLLTHGDLNTPRWLETFDEVTLVLDRRFVADVVRDGLAPERVQFVSQRSANDATVAAYTDAFRRELATDAQNGPLYADTLAIGFTLHLLSRYAVTKPRIPLPRGKLHAWQLRVVVDFIQANLAENLSLLSLAELARVSPFHFARLFRATVGVPAASVRPPAARRTIAAAD